MNILAELVARISADFSGLTKGLSSAEKAVQDTGRTIGAATDAISEKTEKAAEKMAVAAERTAERTERAAKKAAAEFVLAWKHMGEMQLAIGAAITVSVGAMIKSFTDTGSELHDLSIKTGVSVEALAGLKYAAEQNGASLGTIEMAIKRTYVAISELAEGNTTTTEAFNKLGISLSDLQGLNPEQQFLKIANAIAAIPDPITRSAAATSMFGARMGTDMLPMLSAGADGLQKLIDKGAKATTWTTAMAALADDLGDAFHNLQTDTGGLINVLAAALAPTLKETADKLAEVIGKIRDWAKANPELVREIGTITGVVGVMATTIGGVAIAIWAVNTALKANPIGLSILAIEAFIAIGMLLKQSWETITLGLLAIGAGVAVATGGIALIIEVIAALVFAGIWLSQNWDSVSRFFQDCWYNMVMAALTGVDKILDALQKLEGWIPGFGGKIEEAQKKIRGMIDAEKVGRDVALVQRATEDLAGTTKKSTDIMVKGINDYSSAFGNAGTTTARTAQQIVDAINRVSGATRDLRQVMTDEEGEYVLDAQGKKWRIPKSGGGGPVPSGMSLKDFTALLAIHDPYSSAEAIFNRLGLPTGLPPPVHEPPPQTAQGGIFTRPQVRLIGEKGPEAVIPLDNISNMKDMGTEQVTDLTIPISIDGEVFTRIFLRIAGNKVMQQQRMI